MSGLLAEFEAPEDAHRAAAELRRAGVGAVETHMPYVAGGEQGSRLPLVVVAVGLLGAAGAFAMQVYATTRGYPLDIGGRPNFAWPAFMPMVFEVGVLSAVATGVIGFLVACRLPALYDPVDEVDGFRRASRDGFFIAVRSDDGAAIGRARALLAPHAPRLLEEFAT